MKKNNPKKPFFKEDKKESNSPKSFGKGEYKGKAKDGNFSKGDNAGRNSSRKKFEGKPENDRSFGERKFGKKPGIFEKKENFSGETSRSSFADKKFSGESGDSKKQFFKKNPESQDGLERPKRDDSSRGRSRSNDERSVEKPFNKAFQSGKETKHTSYKGRGKDQKPIFGESTAPYQRKPEAKGFGKKRFVDQDTNLERPDYNFESLPQKKNKGNADDDLIRLNKYIANSGICGRREADQLISNGLVTVNGEVCTELGRKVKRIDRVVYQGRKINPEKPVYVLLNKPKDFITTTDDPMDRKTVMNLVQNACEERIFPVGRLDRNTTGLLLFTNDGELAAKLSHPSNEIKKIYQVTLDNPLNKKDEEAILEGLTLEDGPVAVDDMQVLSLDRKILGLEIHVGRNRIVRRIFAHLGYEVTALDRVVYAGLDKKDLKRGHYRFLSEQEVVRLKFFV